MKHSSLKLKMSLWFTLILTIICIIILFVMLSIYHSTDKKLITHALAERAEKTACEVGNDRKYLKDLMDGKLADSDFLFDDVQIMIYNESGEHIAGLFLYTELDTLSLSESDEPKKIELNGRNYYYYDRLIRVHHAEDYYVRGIITEDDLLGSLSSHKAILIVIPFLLTFAFVGGYLITGKFLRPIRNIRLTADEIRESGDLTKRIDTSENGDELDELAHTINAMFDKLENDFDAQKQFTSNASHELRTPVSVILAQCEYGFDNADNAEELLQVIASVQKQGYKMSGLINTLLMFTRIEQGTERYPKTETNLMELVHSVCEDIRIIAEKNITINEELVPVTAYVNKEMFTLMTVNLIQNAVRYGKENGNVKVSLNEKDNMVVLSVHDDGIGISDDDLTHIWERFYRSDRSRSSKGLGLGLALVKQIAEFHGGNAEVVSCEGIGSCFTVKVRRTY